VDERVTLVGYTSDPKAEEHAVQFDKNGNVVRGYRGKGWDGQGNAEGPGEIVKGLSGEAVRIMKRPSALTPPLLETLFKLVSQMRRK
jgi:5-oxoprolinase (ATP-hydrolysing)